MKTINDNMDRIICGDSKNVLNELPANSVNLVITSPPYYKQRDYGGGIGNEKSVDLYIDEVLEVFSRCLRLLRHDGNIVFNLGDKYLKGSLELIPYRFTLEAIKRFPVRLVNDITWVKLNPTPRQFNRRLVSSTEPFFHFVISDKYFYDIDSFNKRASGAKRKSSNGSNNIGKKYFDTIKNSGLSNEQKTKALLELRNVIKEVHEGKIESFRMKVKGIHSEPFGGQEGGRKIQLDNNGFTIIKIKGNHIKRDIIESPVETIKGSGHPAVYPVFIVKELIKLLSKEHDIVLDPFVGSGTTAIACKELNRHYIGVDINEEYCRIAEERVNQIQQNTASLEFIM